LNSAHKSSENSKLKKEMNSDLTTKYNELTGLNKFVPCDSIIVFLIKEFYQLDLSDSASYNLFTEKFEKSGCNNVTFTVQIGAFKNPRNFKFNNSKELGTPDSRLGKDGITRFTVGNFKTLEEAEDLRLKLISNGYEDAWLTAKYSDKVSELNQLSVQCDPKIAFELSEEFSQLDLSDLINYQSFIKKCGNFSCENLEFTVQIGAFANPANFKFMFKKDFGTPDLKLGEDGITRFTLGRFKTLAEAEDSRIKLISKGYEGAWLTAIYKRADRKLLEEVVRSNFFIAKM
jgi:hypothetical protein